MLIATLLALAAAPQASPVNCTNPDTQTDMNLCARREYERADAALNAQWALTAAGMKEQDRDFDRSYDTRPGYFDTLLAAQRAWLTYRDRHCDSDGYRMRGGSAESMLISGCRAQLTEARTAQLKALIEEY
jgi:uncharacterized protein YecT (DUF1311 family)